MILTNHSFFILILQDFKTPTKFDSTIKRTSKYHQLEELKFVNNTSYIYFMKPTLYEFNVLSDNEKADNVWEYGKFLTNRVLEGNAINLYSLNDFYAEIWYNQSTNKILKIRSFKSTNPLAPYLFDIRLGLN